MEIDYFTALTARRTYFQTSLAYWGALQATRDSEQENKGFRLKGYLELP